MLVLVLVWSSQELFVFLFSSCQVLVSWLNYFYHKKIFLNRRKTQTTLVVPQSRNFCLFGLRVRRDRTWWGSSLGVIMRPGKVGQGWQLITLSYPSAFPGFRPRELFIFPESWLSWWRWGWHGTSLVAFGDDAGKHELDARNVRWFRAGKQPYPKSSIHRKGEP